MNLRPMLMSDAEKMLEWKNYPETRKFAIISHDEIKKEDHYKWLETNIGDFQVIDVSNETAGAVRVKDNEVSIWVDRKYWNRGIAMTILLRVAKYGMTAKIVNGNVASFKAFVRAGFRPMDYVDNHYILQWG